MKVKVTLSAEDAERLIDAYSLGLLNEAGVKGVSVCDDALAKEEKPARRSRNNHPHVVVLGQAASFWAPLRSSDVTSESQAFPASVSGISVRLDILDEARRGLLLIASPPDTAEANRVTHHLMEYHAPASLAEMMASASSAAICGAESWYEVSVLARKRLAFLRQHLLPCDEVPNSDAFEQLFSMLVPEPFAEAAERWMVDSCQAVGLIQSAADEPPTPTYDGALPDDATAIPRGTADQLIIGQRSSVGARDKHVHEILRTLDLNEALVAGDGDEVAAEIIRRGGGQYMLSVRDDHSAVMAARRLTEGPCEVAVVEGRRQAEGRDEEWDVRVLRNVRGIAADWPDATAVVQLNREWGAGGGRSSAVSYWLTSYAGTAEELGRWAREPMVHQGMFPWVLDVAFPAERKAIRKANAEANLAIIRRLAESLLLRAPGEGCLEDKRRRAAQDDAYLLQVLQELLPQPTTVSLSCEPVDQDQASCHTPPMTPDNVRAHRHSSHHRDEVLASEVCGCFYCTATFPPSEIKEWVDEHDGVGQTALCPKCGIDSVVGSESGYPITGEFLRTMEQRWFGS